VDTLITGKTRGNEWMDDFLSLTNNQLHYYLTGFGKQYVKTLPRTLNALLEL